MRKLLLAVIFCAYLFAVPAFCADTANVAGTTYVTADTLTSTGTPSSGSEVTRNKIQLVPEPLIKRIDVNRIGTEPAYQTFAGQRLGDYFPAKYFTIAQRVEIYQEAKPIDTFILDAKKIRWLHWQQPWQDKSNFRAQVKPMFTRAYGTELTMSMPNNPDAQIRYTLDYRDIYNNQFPIYVANPQSNRTDIPYTINTNYKHEQWDQNEILYMYSKKIAGIEWLYTMNLGYRYSTMNAKNDGSTFAYYENRHTILTYFSLAPTDRMEWVGQFEYFKSHRPHSTYIYNPDHYFYATELRMKSLDKKTSVIPRFSWSIDKYYPFRNTFQKYEMQVRVGHDFTPKFNATTTFRTIMSFRDEVDNTAPTYLTSNPINDMAGWVGNETRAQYNFYDRFWLQGGADYSAGTNMSDFDNWAYLTGLEYYAPGLLRVDVGYKGNYYYHITKYISSFYFKFYLFM